MSTPAQPESRALTLMTGIALATVVVSIVGLIADPRTTMILGTPAWAKAFKFAVSMVLYGVSLTWALRRTEGRMRTLAARAGNVIGVALIIETALLITQAVRARPMHFNRSTPLDAALFTVMGVTIGILLIAFIVFAVAVWRGIRTERVFAWSVRLGLVICTLGLAEGGLMPTPTPAQQAAMESGAKPAMVGAHTVGSDSVTPDAGPSMRLLGWSTEHGDLRVGHFVGMHALQLIPLFGVLIARRRDPTLTEDHRVAFVWIAAVGYAGIAALVTWQALRGQALIAPDARTLAALGAWSALVAAFAFAVATHAKVTAHRLALSDTAQKPLPSLQ